MKKYLQILVVAGAILTMPFLMGALTVDQILNNIYDSTETALKFYLIYDEVIGDFLVDDTTFFVDATNNRVGVGTITPDNLIEGYASTALTNTVTYPLKLTHHSSGTETAGIGVGIVFDQDTTGSNEELMASVEAVTTDVTGASEDADLIVKLMAAGAAMAEKLRVVSDGTVTQTMTGTVKHFVYSADALADDGTVSLPDASNGILSVACNAEMLDAVVASDGSVVLTAGVTTNTAATDSDGNLCVYDGGTGAVVKNRLGATGNCIITYDYDD